MKRRDYLKASLLGSVVPFTFGFNPVGKWLNSGVSISEFKSNWQDWRDMKWVGPQYWGNRLQDWYLEGGRAVCQVTDRNRSLHLLTVQNVDGSGLFEMSVDIEIVGDSIETPSSSCIGFRIGANGPFPDYRSAAVFGQGLDLGVNSEGHLVIDDQVTETGLEELPNIFKLHVSSEKGNFLLVKLIGTDGQLIFQSEPIPVQPEQLVGNLALLSHFETENPGEREKNSVSFSNWHIRSDGLKMNEAQQFGPICFAQYTLHRGVLKLTAQMAPVEMLPGHGLKLEFRKNGQWETAETAQITHPGRAVNFRIKDWNEGKDIPYRLLLDLPLKQGTRQYRYEGIISGEPINKNELVAAVFSCNFHYGFPDADIYESVSKLNPDIVYFLGDQFYEGTGGFGVQYTAEFDKACLDYLRKWMMFGWSYRDIFRTKPCAIIPDDHDVWHGNVWGEGGKKADTSSGFGSPAQDTGGYKMQAQWVNMVQFTQTSHLPDPYDPKPVKQGIGVYYTHWNYAGISMAILEDRKFKSAPKNILPEEAEVFNGWIMNDNFDITEHRNLEAELLGPRQEKFLEEWVEDWSQNAQLKVVLSQTNFATVATLPEDAKNDGVVPSLPIPEKGEYVEGDRPTVDMDSNGWPSPKRDKAVSIIRKGFAFHIAGDQHLATFVQYGVDEFGDSGYAFAGPAINNVWPRRFWPPVEDTSDHTYENPAYTGNHLDGFGNRVTVKAVGNPYNGHKEPKVLFDRSVGYGIVRFNKKDRTITTECYKRFHDPFEEDSQYPGWPITINQEDNFGKKPEAWLPEIVVNREKLPVISIFNSSGELLYSLRIPGNNWKPKVFAEGIYTLKLSIPETGEEMVFEKVKAKIKQRKKITF